MIKLKMKNCNTILTAKISPLSCGTIDDYECLTGEEILLYDQSRMIEQAKLTYCLLGKGFKKQMKTIEDQGEKQVKAIEEHGKQQVKYSDEKETLAHAKQKEILIIIRVTINFVLQKTLWFLKVHQIFSKR